MTRTTLSFLLFACATDPASEDQHTTSPPPARPLVAAPTEQVIEEVPGARTEEPAIQLTPAQTGRIAEAQVQARTDLAEGVVQILDFGELPPADYIDPKTGLPLGSMGCEWDEEMEVWRDAYNDTVLAHVKTSPPFPPEMEILYTISSWPDEVRHLSIRVTADAIERQVESLEEPTELTTAERLQLGSLAQSSKVAAEQSNRTPGMYFMLQVQSETDPWMFTGPHPEESTEGLGKLTQLLDTIGSR